MGDIRNPEDTMAVAEAAATTSGNSGTKFPHTRALLTALAREYGTTTRTSAKPASEHSDSEPDSGGEVDTFNSDNLVAQVIQLLDEDEEEKVKNLLKENFDITDETVRALFTSYNTNIYNTPVGIGAERP